MNISMCLNSFLIVIRLFIPFLIAALIVIISRIIVQLIPQRRQLILNLIILFKIIDPIVVIVVRMDAAVPFGQMFRIDVLMQTVHIIAVEKDALLHPLVQEGLENVVHHLEDPRLVHDVEGVDFHRKRGLKHKQFLKSVDLLLY